MSKMSKLMEMSSKEQKMNKINGDELKWGAI
jgi:hypothetical protein